MSGEKRPSYEFGPFRLDLAEHRVTHDGQVVPLTPKVFEVLRVLVENAGHLVEKETLLKAVWPDNFVEEGALNRCISVIRKALGETVEHKYIETVPKLGYRFIAPVRSCDDRPSLRDRGFEAAGTGSGSSETRGELTARVRGVFASIPSRRAAIVVTVLLVVAAVSSILLREAERPAVIPVRLDPQHKQVTFTGKESAPALSPDGKRIAYVSNDAPEKKVLVQELAGGSALAILTAPEAGHLRWSPDGSELLVWARGARYNGVYVIPQMGGTPRLVAPRNVRGVLVP